MPRRAHRSHDGLSLLHLTLQLSKRFNVSIRNDAAWHGATEGPLPDAGQTAPPSGYRLFADTFMCLQMSLDGVSGEPISHCSSRREDWRNRASTSTSFDRKHLLALKPPPTLGTMVGGVGDHGSAVERSLRSTRALRGTR